MPLLSLLKYLNWKNTVIGGLVVAVVFLLQCVYKQHAELVEARLVYQHPDTKTADHVVYREGPVRIKTVVVKEKDGDEVTTREEERGPATTESASSSASTIVPVSLALAPARTDRYLLSAGLNRLSADLSGKALFVGYGWQNRLDLQIGVVRRDGTSPWILATIRF